MSFNLDKLHTETPQPQKEDREKLSFLQREVTFFKQPFGNKHKEEFYLELSVLLQAGIPLKEALSLLGENKPEKIKTMYGSLLDKIVSGNSFSNAIRSHNVFTDYEYHSLKIGEEAGMLPIVTQELGTYFMKKNEQKRNLVSLLAYPAVIVLTAFAVVGFMLRFVVPMFEDIFAQNKIELPYITRVIIKLSGLVNINGWFFVLFIAAVFALVKFVSAQQWFHNRKDLLLLKIPVVKDFIRVYYLAQFSHAVALLSASKIPITNIIVLVEKMVDFYPMKTALKTVEEKLLQGYSLSESLKTSDIFDKKMITLVKVAEETNQTDVLFSKLNQQYAKELEHKSKILSSLLEPVIILFLGVFVGFILIAMYLPMFKISSVI